MAKLNPRVNELLEEHRIHHTLIADMLEGLTNEQLKLSVGKGMGTLGMQFRHVADIESCYIEALKTGNMDFSRQAGDRTIEGDRLRLMTSLMKNQTALKKAVSSAVKSGNRKINWSRTYQNYGFVSVEKHLLCLVEHEVLHSGELIVYMRTLGLEFPVSWKLWGLKR